MEDSNKSENSTVDKYLSPNEGTITTIIFPAFSTLFATPMAALIAAPEEMPTRTPCVWVCVCARETV